MQASNLLQELCTLLLADNAGAVGKGGGRECVHCAAVVKSGHSHWYASR